MPAETDMSKNLRFICASVESSASICRDLGMNQQQFSKYLNGVSRPSPHNLRKIATYFGLEDNVFDLPHAEFTNLGTGMPNDLAFSPRESLSRAFPGDLKALRDFVGSYRVFYTSPAVPNKIIASAIFLDEKEGLIYTRSIEALRAEGDRRRQWSRCEGQASYHGERLFVIDFEERNGGSLSMTTLIPPHRYQQGLIYGMMFFLASYPPRTPYASRVVWQRVEQSQSTKSLLQSCASFHMDSLNIHPAIRKYLGASEDQMSMDPPLPLR